MVCCREERGITLQRIPEQELMDLEREAVAYAQADFRTVNDAFVALLLDLEPHTGPLRVLDLGTGPGEIPLKLAAARPSWRICGMDASWPMLAWARRAQHPDTHVCWIQADAKRCPFPAHSFEVLMSNSILHHVADPAALWGSVRELARPGALVFFRDLLRPESAEAAAALVQLHAGNESTLLQEEFYRSFLAAYTPQEIRAQLESAGLSELIVRQITDRHMDIVGRIEID